jgi:TetR/AcrR family transcriptional regulator, regulator of mycofactocin system
MAEATGDREGGTADSPRGRRPSTTRTEVARAALELFKAQGYDDTTVDQIAAAVGVSRRTFFRYFESKRDVVWGEFDVELLRLDHQLNSAPGDEPMMVVLRRAVVATNHFNAGELDDLRIRMGLITSVETLVADSAVRYADWCRVVAAFVAGRIGAGASDLVPQTVARAALGAAMAAFTRWASHETDDLTGPSGSLPPGLTRNASLGDTGVCSGDVARRDGADSAMLGRSNSTPLVPLQGEDHPE